MYNLINTDWKYKQQKNNAKIIALLIIYARLTSNIELSTKAFKIISVNRSKLGGINSRINRFFSLL